jgi:tetratricopeptide (TPR) repeat protein
MAAEPACRAAITLAPGEYRWLTNLGVALFTQGRHQESEACYRKAMELKPDYAMGHSNLLFALGYRTDLTAEAIFAEYQEWDRRHAAPLAVASPPFDLDRTPGRRLRVGYVSADFRDHAAALFAAPLLLAHDRSQVELFLYAGVAAEDTVTARLPIIGEARLA